MVVTPGFALFERFFPYVTWNVISRMHTRLLLGKSTYALIHTVFIIDLSQTDFLSSFPSVLTVDTSYLLHQEHILSSTTSSSKLPSSSSSGLPQTSIHIRFTLFTKSIRSRITSLGGLPSRTTHVNSRKSSSSFSGLPSRTTLCIILPTISPFGLDGNHDGVWFPQQIGTLRIQ